MTELTWKIPEILPLNYTLLLSTRLVKTPSPNQIRSPQDKRLLCDHQLTTCKMRKGQEFSVLVLYLVIQLFSKIQNITQQITSVTKGEKSSKQSTFGQCTIFSVVLQGRKCLVNIWQRTGDGPTLASASTGSSSAKYQMFRERI